MSIKIKIPDIGIDEAEVTEILVKIGDKVDIDQSLITIEGNKTSMEIPSPQVGIVKEIKISVGDKVNTNKLIMILEEMECSADKYIINASKEPDKTKKTESVIYSNTINNETVTIPEIGNNELRVKEIFMRVGDEVKVEQPILILENHHILIKILATCAGIVKKININIDDKVSNRSVIMLLEAKKNQSDLLTKDQTEIIKSTEYIHATPAIRQLAREFDINLANVQGTGHKKRILREDIQMYIKSAIKYYETKHLINNPISLKDPLTFSKVDFKKSGDIEEIKLNKIQKNSGFNLQSSWKIIPHVTQFDEVDITELDNFRKQQILEAQKKKIDVKITLLVFIMKAVAKGLESLPRFNSSLSEDKEKIILKKYINIGIAVDTPSGLVVPVFRDINNKGILDLSKELIETSKRARTGKLSFLEMQGGTFTISNLGGIGGQSFTPIINAPEVAILGVSKTSIKPVWNNEKFMPRIMLPLSLSYDHRVIDGADGARFICLINKLLSDIRCLLI